MGQTGVKLRLSTHVTHPSESRGEINTAFLRLVVLTASPSALCFMSHNYPARPVACQAPGWAGNARESQAPAFPTGQLASSTSLPPLHPLAGGTRRCIFLLLLTSRRQQVPHVRSERLRQKPRQPLSSLQKNQLTGRKEPRLMRTCRCARLPLLFKDF